MIKRTPQQEAIRKVVALQAFLKKQEKAQINNLTLHLKELKTTTTTTTTTKPTVSRRKEIIKSKQT